jgi:hypothetical protein
MNEPIIVRWEPPHQAVAGMSWRTIARFWSKVQRLGADECWPWIGTVNPNGYGSFGVGKRPNGRQFVSSAHRAAYCIFSKKWPPKGMVVMHTCDDRACVNPAHLKLGTQKDNLRDAVKKGRHRGRIRVFDDAEHRANDKYDTRYL